MKILNSNLFWLIDSFGKWFKSTISTKTFAKLILYILTLFMVFAFFSCKKEDDTKPAPNPYIEPTFKPKFEIKLIYPIADTLIPEIEVNQGDQVKLVFRFTSDMSISVIDVLTKDQERGENSLSGYPYSIGTNSYSLERQENPDLKFIGSNYFILTKEIAVPTFVKDSLIVTAKAINYNLSSRIIKVKLKIKKQIDFQIINFKINDIPFYSIPIELLSSNGIYKFFGNVNTSGKLLKLKLSLFANNSEVTNKVIPYVVDQYYNTRNINGTYTFNYGGSYSSYTPNSILAISRDCFGKSLKLKITAFIDSGDSTSLEVPLNLLLKETIQAGPFNL